MCVVRLNGDFTSRDLFLPHYRLEQFVLGGFYENAVKVAFSAPQRYSCVRKHEIQRTSTCRALRYRSVIWFMSDAFASFHSSWRFAFEMMHLKGEYSYSASGFFSHLQYCVCNSIKRLHFIWLHMGEFLSEISIWTVQLHPVPFSVLLPFLDHEARSTILTSLREMSKPIGSPWLPRRTDLDISSVRPYYTCFCLRIYDICRIMGAHIESAFPVLLLIRLFSCLIILSCQLELTHCIASRNFICSFWRKTYCWFDCYCQHDWPSLCGIFQGANQLELFFKIWCNKLCDRLFVVYILLLEAIP